MNIKNLILEVKSPEEKEFESDFAMFYDKSLEKAKLTQNEYDEISKSEKHQKKVRRELKIRRDQFDRYTLYSMKEQIDIYKKLEKIMFSTDSKNKETLLFLGDLIFSHIKEFCEKNRLIDEEIIKMVAESNILDDDDKKEFELEKKSAASKKTKTKQEGDLTSKDYRLLIQKKLYIQLLKIRYEVMGFKMRLGMIFYKYIAEENAKHNLINKYLLYRIDQYVNEPPEVEEDED